MMQEAMTSVDVFDFSLERESSRPLYQQIKLAIQDAIEQGALLPLTKLPATRQLARQLGVNRVTVVTAYAELEAEGYITSQVGRGSFVLDRAVHAPAAEQKITPPSLRDPREWTAHHFNREMMRWARRPDVLSFAPGMPATDLLPVEEYRRAINTVLRRDGADVMQYGPVEGYRPLHESIVAELAQTDIDAGPDRVLVTSGAEQAVALVLRTVLQPGDVILIEHPTYMHVLDLLAGSGIVVHPVPCDEEGLVVDGLDELIEASRPRLLYLTPTYQNPTGACMSLLRRRRLLQVARAHRLLILEDDVYRHLWLQAPPPPPLRALDDGDHVIYINGYSKCLLPGARIGYLLPPERLYEELAAVHQTLDVTATELNQRALTVYLQGDQFGMHLRRLRAHHEQRCQALMAALAEHMPAGTRWSRPQGGLFLWVQLPSAGPSATTLYVHALERGVTFAPGHLFFLATSVARREASHYLRLNFALHTPEVVRDGIRRLAQAWQLAGGL